MRSLLTAVAALCACACTALAEPSTQLTVLLSIEGRASDAVLKELKHELSSIMKDTGRPLDVRLRSQANPEETFEDVVLVKLRGTCKMERIIPFIDERGPLAWTHSTDGVILPFAEVSCDRLAHSVASALWGSEKNKPISISDERLGGFSPTSSITSWAKRMSTTPMARWPNRPSAPNS